MTATGELSMIAPLTALVRRLRLLILLPLLLAAGGVAWTWLTREYVSESVFMPEAGTGQNAQLIGLAAQFGINLGMQEPALSVDFYRSLLYGRELLTTAAQTKYRFATAGQPADDVSRDLLEVYEIPEGPEDQRLFRAQQRLRGNVYVGIDRPAGVVTIRVTAESPELAEQINRRLLELVNTFNLESLQSSAVARRDFASERLREVEADLAEAEKRERDFLEANRGFENSPELTLTHRRLQRDVSLAQQLYVTVAQSYEQARVDAIRDVPVITIVESPEGSARVARRLQTSATVGLLLGLAAALGIVVLSEFVAMERRHRPDAYATFDRVWRDAMSSLGLRRD